MRQLNQKLRTVPSNTFLHTATSQTGLDFVMCEVLLSVK